MDYATAEALRGYLDQVEVTTATDEVLGDILARASATVRTSLRSLLADSQFDFAADYAAASTAIVTAYGGAVLLLPPHLSASVSEVEYVVTTNPTTWAALTDEWYEQQNGSLYRPYGWGYGYHPTGVRYRVTARWGYGPVPSEIEQVTLELAVNIWRSKDKGGFTEMVGVESQGGIRAVARLTRDQKAVLEAWANTMRGVAV
jgi:hypothetical protein